MTDIWDISRRLSERLANEPWYHRIVISDIFDEQGRMTTRLVVWGEHVRGRQPDIPTEFDGYPVIFHRVTPDAECPFGSVRKRTRSRAEQDAGSDEP